jgi:hypothetical protein
VSPINSSSVAQGESISINVTLVSKSNETEVTVLLYLGSAYENQPFSGYTVIATPSPPYSGELPWEQIDASTEHKPFIAAFDINPVVMQPNGTETVGLTILAAENATLGAYNMDVAISDYPWTVRFHTGFQLTVILAKQQAIQTGRDFLDSRNCTTGSVLIAEVKEKTPDFYWHELFGLGKPDVEETALCWVVRFEQAARPGHFFEVWIDAYTGYVVGGTQCR